MLESDVESVVREVFVEIDWNTLRNELLRDGLLVQFSSAMNFAHHSYQEFFTACHLVGDLRPERVNGFCEDYLKGSDWWREVLGFYIDLIARPQETHAWVSERLRMVCKDPSADRSLAEERALSLRQQLDTSFPFAQK